MSRNAWYGSSSNINRRRFIELGGMLGAATMLPTFAARGDPVSGGVLRVSFPDAPISLDPHKARNISGQCLSGAIFDNLTALDESGRVIPRLATSWEAENGGRSWVFTLREDVKFHNGAAFTAEDVTATINRAYDAAQAFTARGQLGPDLVAATLASNKVRIESSMAFAELPTMLANPYGRIVSAGALDSLETHPVGTGPFTFDSFVPQSGARVVKNGSYWGEAAHLDAIEFVSIKESVPQQAALQDGSVDIALQLGSATLLALKSTNVVTVADPSSTYIALITSSQFAPFDNADVRAAFKLLISRQSLLNSANLGYGQIGNDMPYPKEDHYGVDLAQHEQNLDEAKRLLDRSGADLSGLEVYTTDERPPAPMIALALQDGARRVGLDIPVRNVTYAQYSEQVSRKKPLYTTGLWPSRLSVYEKLYLPFRSGAVFNFNVDEQVEGLDALIDQAVSELDDDKRRTLVREAQVKLYESGTQVIPFFTPTMYAHSPRVNGLGRPKANIFDFSRVWLSS